MQKLEAVIDTMFAGTPAPLDERGTMSAIRKSAVSAPWYITPEGLLRDEQADHVHHGGRDKALHQYPQDHYVSWVAEFGTVGEHHFAPGGFGENLSIATITEADVCIGDIFRAGSSRLQISQGRQPCFKLNARFGEKRMASLVQKTGRTGWYYRVIESGIIEEGDALTLVERPQPLWSLKRVTELLYVKTLDLADLEALAEVPELADGWRTLARRRVASRSVESWKDRLEGASGD